MSGFEGEKCVIFSKNSIESSSDFKNFSSKEINSLVDDFYKKASFDSTSKIQGMQTIDNCLIMKSIHDPKEDLTRQELVDPQNEKLSIEEIKSNFLKILFLKNDYFHIHPQFREPKIKR